MPAFDLSYDEEEDVLEVTFGLFDERASRPIVLNDHIVLMTDLTRRTVWGITFYGYAHLLAVSETELSGLKEAADADAEALLRLLTMPPASAFFDVTRPHERIARVLAPRLLDLFAE